MRMRRATDLLKEREQKLINFQRKYAIYLIFFETGLVKIGKAKIANIRTRISSYLKPWCKKAEKIVIIEGNKISADTEKLFLDRFVGIKEQAMLRKRLKMKLGLSVEVCYDLNIDKVLKFSKQKNLKTSIFTPETIQEVHWHFSDC